MTFIKRVPSGRVFFSLHQEEEEETISLEIQIHAASNISNLHCQPRLCSLGFSWSPPSLGCHLAPTSSYIQWQYLRWWFGSFQGFVFWWSPMYNGGEHVITLLLFSPLISLLLQRSISWGLRRIEWSLFFSLLHIINNRLYHQQ